MELTKKDVLIYSNDFRDLQLPKLKETELKAYLAILFNLQGKGSNEVRLFNDDLFLPTEQTWEYRTKIMDNLRKKFVSFAMRKITETPTHIIDETTLFFKKIIIHYQKENPDDGRDTSKLFECIDVQINEEFVPLINNLKKHFTKAEMGEILNLSGCRSIRLYLDLKTFKTTGEYIISLDEFRAKFEVPENYKMCHIDKEILAPMLKELNKPRNLFDQVRIAFENLKVEKIKGKGRGRGGGVVKLLKFTFKPQRELTELEKAKETIAKVTKERDFAYQQTATLAHALGVKNEYQHYVERHYRNSNGECLKITDIVKLTGGALKVEFKNQENESKFYREFDSENHFKKYLGNLTSY